MPAAMLTAVVVLPTPPFRLNTATTAMPVIVGRTAIRRVRRPRTAHGYTGRPRRRGRVARQRPAKPSTPVRFWSSPLVPWKANARGRTVSHRRGSFPLTAAPGVPSHRTWLLRRVLPVAVATVTSLVAAGCGDAGYATEPRPIGVGDRFTLTAGAVDSAGLPCGQPAGSRFGIHLELFVDGWVVLVPSGIGIRPPWVGTVPYVRSGACE